MVGKRETKTEEVDSDYFKRLKLNNITLAKALTEERLNCKQFLEERIAVQRKLDAALLLNVRYETILSKLLTESKRTVPVCTAILANIQQIITLCSEGMQLPKLIDWESNKETSTALCNNKRSASPIVNKTHAVKPMVSGHVIFRPTINLWRLSENAELTRNLDSPITEIDATTSTSNDINNGPVQGLDRDIFDLDTSDLLTDVETETELLNGRVERLDPVHEESENEIDLSHINLREARIVIDPLSVVQTPPSTKKRYNSTINADPLEGPSTLLNDSGEFTTPPSKYISKPRVARTHYSLVNKKEKRFNSDLDSSSDEEPKRKPVQNSYRNVSKRKPKDDEAFKIHHKKKVKKDSPAVSPDICQPYVVLQREDLSMHENSTPQNDQFVNSRPRRNKVKGNFREMSLRW